VEAVSPAERSRHIGGAGTTPAAWRADAALAAVPDLALDTLAPPGARVVLAAPHPDDEILAWGGLLAMLARRGAEALLVAVTDGDGSHPGSPAWPPARLRATRPRETEAALAALGAAPEVVRLGIFDGGVRSAEAELARRLAALLRPGDVVVTTWRHDGHPDHEATARACAAAALACDATLLETPVWGWHWTAPGDGMMPLSRARKLALAPELLAGKRAALACFTSQIEPDASTGAGPVVPAHALERLLQPFELFFRDA
jgi:LmbE family N-acetylglucosaminyl deacetylase